MTEPDGEPTIRKRGTVLSALDITKDYHTGDIVIHALRGVAMDLYEGELVVLVGPSGSGKSTLLNILGGIDSPTSGRVIFRDKELTGLDNRRLTAHRRNCMGFVFQFYNLIPSLTAGENVTIVTEISSNPMSAEEALGMVGLEERIDHFPAQLSGGEQQRVAIARAIAKRPDILLCDEPTGALDSKTGTQVLEAIEHTNQTLGTTTALITHNAIIADMADRVMTFSDGRIVDVQSNASRRPVKDLSW